MSGGGPSKSPAAVPDKQKAPADLSSHEEEFLKSLQDKHECIWMAPGMAFHFLHFANLPAGVKCSSCSSEIEGWWLQCRHQGCLQQAFRQCLVCFRERGHLQLMRDATVKTGNFTFRMTGNGNTRHFEHGHDMGYMVPQTNQRGRHSILKPTGYKCNAEGCQKVLTFDLYMCSHEGCFDHTFCSEHAKEHCCIESKKRYDDGKFMKFMPQFWLTGFKSDVTTDFHRCIAPLGKDLLEKYQGPKDMSCVPALLAKIIKDLLDDYALRLIIGIFIFKFCKAAEPCFQSKPAITLIISKTGCRHCRTTSQAFN